MFWIHWVTSLLVLPSGTLNAHDVICTYINQSTQSTLYCVDGSYINILYVWEYIVWTKKNIDLDWSTNQYIDDRIEWVF